MEYMKLFVGIGILVVFCWILVRNSKRTGILHSLLRVDTIIGIVAGLYLVFTSVLALA